MRRHNQLFLSLSDYRNQSLSETSGTSRLSEVFNPNYEDLSVGWGAASPPLPLEELKSLGPEYLNTAQSSLPAAAGDSLDNPDYQADFLPGSPATPPGNALFLPGAENLEYLGLGAAPVR